MEWCVSAAPFMPDALDQLAAQARRLSLEGKPEEALWLLAAFVRTLNTAPGVPGNLFGSPALDALWGELAQELPEPLPQQSAISPDPEAQIYVVSDIASTGGHTRLLLDMIRAQAERPQTVLLTNLFDRSALAAEAAGLVPENVAAIELAPEGSLLGKIHWLTHALERQPKARVFLLPHHEDIAALAAVRRAARARVFFCHHADHHLALGLHVPAWRHLDVTAYSHAHCRHSLGVQNVAYLPLISAIVPAREQAEFAASPGEAAFVTCSAGSPGKFARDYVFSYVEMIAQRLASFGGSHVHIGGLGEKEKTRLQRACAERGLEAARFREVPFVPSLAQAMAEEKVSVYLTSFPIAGARTAIEVMSSGTPILGHRHFASDFLGGQGQLPEGTPIWHCAADFLERLAEMAPEKQRALAAANRAFWERCHHPARLAECLADDSFDLPPPPRAEAQRIDPLRLFLAGRSAEAALWDSLAHYAESHIALAEAKGKAAALKQSLLKASERVVRLKEEHPAQQTPWTWKLLRPLARLEGWWRRR